MPAALSYPGVYIEEIPSGVRTITGVATSITAFLGRAVSGPTNNPTTINSFADFERQFGGLGIDFPMSYSVRDFYLNGGRQAIIVRLFKPKGSGTGRRRITVGGLNLDAASPGAWANALSVSADTDDITDDVAKRYGLAKTDLFNLTVSQTVNGREVVLERLTNLSVKQDQDSSAAARARRVDRVLQQSSQYVRLAVKDGKPDLPSTVPSGSSGTAPAPAAPGPGGPAAAPGGAAPAAASSSADLDSQSLNAEDFIGKPAEKTGLSALDTADLFNLLCIPPDTRGGDTPPSVYQAAMAYCAARRAMLIVDSPNAWDMNPVGAASAAKTGLGTLGLTGDGARNAALYFPRVIQPDPLSQGQLDKFVPCGIIAGLMAATDAQRGVWKAPAGLAAALTGIGGLQVNLTDDENGMLNPIGINCLRTFPISGTVIWGARTLRGADQLADEYKYVPVRRLALFIEETLFRGTQWVVFEPNDEPLWAQIRLNVGAFMHTLFVQGAFQGQTPAAAYFVKCDKDTTTQNDIDRGIVNIIVGFAPLKPAEFVVIKIQQIAGNIQT
jgi:Bacteriophage tail sheath protein